MKVFFNVFVCLFLFFAISCQNSTKTVGPYSQEKRYGNEKTSSALTISTPTTLTSGYWDVIEIVNGGSLYIPGGTVSCTTLNNATTSGRVIVTISSGATFVVSTANIKNMLPTNEGHFGVSALTSNHSNAVLANFGTVSSSGTGIEWNAGQLNNYGNIDAYIPGNCCYPSIKINGGNINFFYCAGMRSNWLYNNSANSVTGNGRIKADTGILNSVLTASSGIRYCALTSGSGGQGSAVTDCVQASCP